VSYRPLDHTADLGFEIDAPDLASLYAEAARAFSDAITDVGSIRPCERRILTVEAADAELLLVEWLGELLVRFDVEGWLPAQARAAVREDGEAVHLRVEADGEIFDPARHVLRVAVKAVTYHGLSVRRDGDVWRARVILDI